MVWSSSSNGVLRSQYQSTFSAVASLPSSAVVASDKRNNSYFYAGSDGSFYVSSDTGSTFTKGGALGSATAIRDIAAHPATAGEVWVSTDVGIFKSPDFGRTFSQVGSALTDTQQIALGLGSGSTWNLYAFGTGSAGNKLYASSDSGATWTDIQGSQGFGSISSCKLAGSANNAGQVYVGTNGRGVFYASGAVAGGGGGSTSASAPATSKVSTTGSSAASSTATTLTTTTVRSSSASMSMSGTTSVPSPSSTAAAQHYAQCGGIGWTGPTVCASGYTCQKQNEYYSQCL